jgi:hypothetical protein
MSIDCGRGALMWDWRDGSRKSWPGGHGFIEQRAQRRNRPSGWSPEKFSWLWKLSIITSRRWARPARIAPNATWLSRDGLDRGSNAFDWKGGKAERRTKRRRRPVLGITGRVVRNRTTPPRSRPMVDTIHHKRAAAPRPGHRTIEPTAKAANRSSI